MKADLKASLAGLEAKRPQADCDLYLVAGVEVVGKITMNELKADPAKAIALKLEHKGAKWYSLQELSDTQFNNYLESLGVKFDE